uniref:Uncharacterized protein n=1 Tax=Arundo donax TaxID=35708 RepID=A0A0A9B820_ARUDO
MGDKVSRWICFQHLQMFKC